MWLPPLNTKSSTYLLPKLTDLSIMPYRESVALPLVLWMKRKTPCHHNQTLELTVTVRPPNLLLCSLLLKQQAATQDSLNTLHAAVCKKDDYDFFKVEVTDAIAPRYSQIIRSGLTRCHICVSFRPHDRSLRIVFSGATGESLFDFFPLRRFRRPPVRPWILGKWAGSLRRDNIPTTMSTSKT